MKKQNPLILQIPTSCSENWSEMTVADQGRFCSYCRKTVTDISNMTDSAVALLFQQEEPMSCIRALSSQLNRPIAFPPQVPTRFYRIAVALGLTIMLSGTSDVYARPRPPLTGQHYLPDAGCGNQPERTAGDTLKISGVVYDETGKPFPGVIVRLLKEGVGRDGAITADDGTFMIESVQGIYDLEFRSTGYTVHKIPINKDKAGKPAEIRMHPESKHRMGGFTIIKELIRDTAEIDPPGRKTYTKKVLKQSGF